MKKQFKTTIVLLAIVLFITILPLIILKDADFEGADGKAEVMISEINPDYQPWFESFLPKLSGETESLLFCIQAAIGSSVLGYGFGYLVAKKKHSEKKEVNV